MGSSRVYLLVLWAVLTLSTTHRVALAEEMVAPEVTTEEEQQQDVPDDEVPECGLYLAVSSTSTTEEPKWGLYAGHAIPKQSPVGSGEVAVHTFHLLANSLSEKGSPDSLKRLDDIVDYLEQYIWVPHGSGGQFELEDGGRIVTAVPGVGVVGGCKLLYLFRKRLPTVTG